MRSLRLLFLFLLMLAPLASAEWVRFEAEDAILSGTGTQIRDYAGISGGKAVFITNNPNGTIDFVLSVREPNALGTPMRVGFYSDGNNGQKLDNYFVNDMVNKFKDQNWACGYYWDPDMGDSKAKFEDYRNSIVTYGNPEFQVLSRWWPWYAGPDAANVPMTVPLVKGQNTIRIQSWWSNTAYDYIELALPEAADEPAPADGDVEVRSTQTTLSWKNPAGVGINRVYFGQSDTEPNYFDYASKLTTVIDVLNPGASPVINMPVPLQDGKNYYWMVDANLGTTMPAEPNFPGAIWHFATQFNAAPIVTVEAPNAYLSQGGVPGQVIVSLDATVSEPVTSYQWSYISGATAGKSLAPNQMTTLSKWWGDTLLDSAAVAGDACRYSMTMVGTNTEWGEQIRLVQYDNNYGFQAGDSWKQRFVSPAENLYSIEVTMYYTVAGGTGGSVTGVLEPGTELSLSLNIANTVQWYGLEFTTGFEKGAHPTTPGTTGTLNVDVYQDATPVLPVINSPNTEDTTVTIFNEGHPYVFQLTVNDGARSGIGTVSFHVDNTSCEAARRTPNTQNAADINLDCRVNMVDFELLASNWLNCLDTLTGNNCK